MEFSIKQDLESSADDRSAHVHFLKDKNQYEQHRVFYIHLTLYHTIPTLNKPTVR